MEEEFNANNNLFGQANEPQDLKGLLTSPNKFRCVGFKEAKYICAQKNCKSPGFSCINSECECNQVHKLCKSIQLKRVANSLIKKNKPMPEQFKESYKILQLKINDMIQQLSDLRTRFELQEEYFGLLKQDVQFIKYVKEGRPQQINGQIISNMEANLESEFQFYMEPKDDIIKSFEKKRQAFTKLIQSIQTRYTYRDKKFRNKIFLDSKNKKILQSNEVSRENAKQMTSFEFFPITVNQKIGPFLTSQFRMTEPLESENFQKVNSDCNWKQVVSNQQLPRQGQYFFEIFCHRDVNNETMVGILTQNCVGAESSYTNRQAMSYYLHTGQLWQNGTSSTTIGRVLHNKRGLITVMVDMDEKQIHWCLDNQYQGKAPINPSFGNFKMFAFIDIYRTNTNWEFINENNEKKQEMMNRK